MKVPVDYFGVAGDSLVRDILDQSSNKRKRKVAVNNIVRLAKACGLIPKNAEPGGVYFFVSMDGSQWLEVKYINPLPLASKGAPE